MPEWLVERGIGETRAALIGNGEILEARFELDGSVPAGTILPVRLANVGHAGRQAIAIADGGIEYLLPRGAAGATEGATINIEVTREAIPGAESWKRPLARVTDAPVCALPSLAQRLGARELRFPAPEDELGGAGWDDLIDAARTGSMTFAGGELRLSPTPAMTLIDVDGHLPPAELAMEGAAEAARAVRLLDIGGSIGIDLPTTSGKEARQRAAAAIDSALPRPFERTAINGFGFVQVIRPRLRSSLLELAQDRPGFEARDLLRRAAFEPAGPKRLVAHSAVIRLLTDRGDWIDQLARQIGGVVQLRADPALPISGGYAESL